MLLRIRPAIRSLVALGLFGAMLGNYYSPTSLRLGWRAFDAPLFCGGLVLLAAVAFRSAAYLITKWTRILIRLIAGAALGFGVLVTAVTLLFWVKIYPVAVATSGANRIVANMAAGGAVGPHYTEFREERPIIVGLILAQTLGYSDAIGDVTLTISPPDGLHAVIEDDASGETRTFETRIPPLMP